MGWRDDYVRHLSSPAWANLRREVIRAQKRLCGACGLKRSRLELHHLHYRTLGREAREDVIALCSWCHVVWDQERAKEGKDRAYNARLEGFAASLGYDTGGMGPVEWEAVESRFHEWIGSPY